MRLLNRLSSTDGSVELRLLVASADDLWHLYNLVIAGDLVRTKTRRKVVKEGVVGSAGAEVKTVVLEVKVCSVDFTPDEVRIQGVNHTMNEYVRLGAYHTLTVQATSPPQTVTVVKQEWNELYEQRLRDACDEDGQAGTVALLMNYGTAQVVVVTSSFTHAKARVDVTIAKKRRGDGGARDKSVTNFYKQTLGALLASVDLDAMRVVLLCSPGNVREEFMQYVRRACQAAASAAETVSTLKTLTRNLGKFVLVKVTTSTVAGLREALHDPAIAATVMSTRCAEDMRAWDSFQAMVNNDPDRCVYTPQYVYRAALAGAVSCLMVSDEVFRADDAAVRHFFLALVHYVRHSGATVRIFSSNHVTGEQLTQLGSVAALLHFACPECDALEVDPDFLTSSEAAEFARANAAARVRVT